MIAAVCLSLLLQYAPGASLVEHDVRVVLTPAAGEIAIVDRLRVPASLPTFTLYLHPALDVVIAGARIVSTDALLGRWSLERTSDVVVVTATGRIVQAPVQAAAEHQRSFQETTGIIEARGVYLSPQSRWLPVIVDSAGAPLLVTGSITVGSLPAGWSALCEGALGLSAAVAGRQGETTWRETRAIEGFHLIAGPFSKAQERKHGVEVMIWLRQSQGADAADANLLAERYLEVTGQYLEQYEKMIGKYPYQKFALVENFWETGYGMPSFTLLGSAVIRLPFILHTSWPHELLHNWWGNGVFVADGGGNWSEGLTAYLADHLNAEQQGKGSEYRRTSLQAYLDFVDVDPKADFPLSAFRGRDSAASQAVGYGKTMMLFHMVRRQIGDAAFIKGLQLLWQQQQQQRASFDDVAAAFSTASGSQLGPLFSAWTTQTGIPTLALRSVSAARSRSGEHTLTVVVEQTQSPLFPFEVPLVVTTVDGRSVSTRAAFQGKTATATLQLPAAMARVDVDPFFDVFRRLDPNEVPPSLSRALGSPKMVLVTPTSASPAEKTAWASFARAICDDEKRCTIVDDLHVGTLPFDAAVWILGYASYLRGGPFVFSRARGMRFDDSGVFQPGAWERVLEAKGTPDRLAALNVERVDTGTTGFVVVVEHPRNPRMAMAFVGAPTSKMIPLLARKIPHYGKYSWLGFSGDAATNTLKGQWTSSTSALAFVAKPQSVLSLKEPPALVGLPPPIDGAALLEVVGALSASTLQGRGRGSAGLAAARKIVIQKLQNDGIKNISEACDIGDPTVCNVVGHIAGTNPSLPRVVLGAHLDHLGMQKKKVFPGADDNASGVAVALEVARQLNKAPQARGVDVVFFDAEESGRLGSISYLAGLPAGSVFAMVNLDTVGRLPDGKPLLLLDGDSASEWVHVARGVAFTTGIALELAPQGGGASDQKSFIDKGIPALHIFAGPNVDYHQPSDTAEKVSSSSLVKTAVVAREIVAFLASRLEPLSFQGTSPSTVGSGERKASLGSVPDMSFGGVGVRFEDIVKGSAAAAAGLQKGDVLVRFDGVPVVDLRSYSDLLKSKKAGDRVPVVVRRGDNGAAVDVAVDVVLGVR